MTPEALEALITQVRAAHPEARTVEALVRLLLQSERIDDSELEAFGRLGAEAMCRQLFASGAISPGEAIARLHAGDPEIGARVREAMRAIAIATAEAADAELDPDAS